MIYDKLPIVLLSTLASEKKGSTNSEIARFILSHLEEVKEYNIKQLSHACHVSNSSISRFCKEIGLDDFMELKSLISMADFSFEKQSQKSVKEERLMDYAYNSIQSIRMVQESLDMKQVKKLCQDIQKYEKISAFGLLKAQTVALNMQSDLLMLDKHIYTSVIYLQQINHLLECDENDLVIIFSYTGTYFDAPHLRAKLKLLKKPKIWMITGKAVDLDFVDEVIVFDSLQNQSSHPTQLQFIETVIVQEYANL